MPTLQGFSPISQFLFPISIFNNSVLLAAATALYMLLRNVFWHWKAHGSLFEHFKNESLGKKILVALTGYKASVSKLKEKWHLYPLEDIESLENGFKRKLIVMPQDEGRNETVERLDNAIKFGKINDAIWATPGLPMLIFITIGLVIALFLGDIVWIFLRLLMG
jgi:preflagellin peptidase FlaK